MWSLPNRVLTAIECVQYLEANGSVFSLPHVAPYEKIFKIIDVYRESHVIHESFTPIYEYRHFLPIEDFRSAPGSSPLPKAVQKFVSSGTTSSKLSASEFTKQGLTHYQNASLITFIDVLSRFFGSPTETQGISLVPKVSEWPHSSLAFMINHFSRSLQVTYKEHTRPLKIETDTPIWIFGTSAHLLELAQRHPVKLPPGSVIFETGGIKKGQKNLSKQELYHLLEANLNVPQDRIIGEYGMCELASQAYDWVEEGNNKPNELISNIRGYRFPNWVQLAVFQGANTFIHEGEGSLTILDRARTDFNSPIRTHDLVTLKDNRFEINGRVPFEVIKGCSNLVAEIKSETLGNRSASRKNMTKLTPPSKKRAQENFHLAKTSILSELENVNSLASLYHEFKSEHIGNWAVDEIRNSLALEFEETAFEKFTAQSTTDNWLVILPQNHSIASLHPIFWASVLGLKLEVRIPKTLEGTFADIAICSLINQGFEITKVPSSFRVTEDNTSIYGGILAFGDQATMSHIESIATPQVQSFGPYIAAVHTNADEIAHFSDWAIQRCFQLGQRGCFSGRAILIEENERKLTNSQKMSIATKLRDSSRSVFSKELEMGMRLALDGCYTAYKRNGVPIPKRENHNEGLFPILDKVSPSELSATPFVCPVVFGKGFANDSFFNSLYHVNQSEQLLWNGIHQGQMLYSPR